MSRQPVPFQGPLIIKTEEVMSRRYRPGLTASENRALTEILNDPDYRILEDTLDAMRHTTPDGKRGRGRPAAFSARQILAVITTALVLNLDLEIAHGRLFGDDTLRAHFGLPPLTDVQRSDLAALIDKGFADPSVPSVSLVRDFVSRWTQTSVQRQDAVYGALRETMLRVAARAINTHDIPTNWVALDGKRVRATTNETDGPGADVGTAVHTRDTKEQAFNQRHHYLAVLGSVPLVVETAITPPQGEITHWADHGIPSLRRAGERLGELITEMRGVDGTRHTGLDLAAVAADGALANQRGIEALIANRFHPATIAPESNPTIRDRPYTADRNGHGLVQYPIRSDATVLCPFCSSTEGKPMEHLAGEFGRYIRVRCPDSICVGHKTAKIPLRATDVNDYLPGTTASRGERNAAIISILPTYSDQYIARRFLASQRIEWTHAMFERHYGLGHKNLGFHRRMISGTHQNQLWWSLAAVIWNITLRLNLDDGRAELTRVKPSRESGLLQKTIGGYWAKANAVERRKQAGRAAADERTREQHRKMTKRQAREEHKHASTQTT